MTHQTTCWECHTLLEQEELGRQATCPRCGRHTHVCRNCRFYDIGYYNNCQEPQAERVVDKEKANFCDYFKGTTAKTTETTTAVDPMAAAAMLFRK